MSNRFRKLLTEEDIKTVEKNMKVYKKLKDISERNIKGSGKLEKYVIELADETGKNIKDINKDIRNEFGTLEVFRDSLEDADYKDAALLRSGLKQIDQGIRVEVQKDSRGKDRNVYILSGLALTQLVTRWDKYIRLVVTILIHMMADTINEMGYEINTTTDLADYFALVSDMATKLKLGYNKLKAKYDKHQHIQDNYDDVLSIVDTCEAEIGLARRSRLEALPTLLRVQKELKNIDKNNANLLEKDQEVELFGKEIK